MRSRRLRRRYGHGHTRAAREAFLMALRRFVTCSHTLARVWPEDGSLDASYPFEKSWDDIWPGIFEWNHIVTSKFGSTLAVHSEAAQAPTPNAAVSKLVDAVYKLLLAWEGLTPQDEDALSEGYPFAKSLDEVFSGILTWKEAIS